MVPAVATDGGGGGIDRDGGSRRSFACEEKGEKEEGEEEEVKGRTEDDPSLAIRFARRSN